MSGGPDRLTELLRDRAALIHRTVGELTGLAERFIADLTALDAEIGTQQRHNLQQTTAATVVAGYETLRRQVDGLADGEAADMEQLSALLEALRAQVGGLQDEVHGLLDREQAREAGA